MVQPKNAYYLVISPEINSVAIKEGGFSLSLTLRAGGAELGTSEVVTFWKTRIVYIRSRYILQSIIRYTRSMYNLKKTEVGTFSKSRTRYILLNQK